jgi:ABC-type phosphate transport system substrate-binding protein
MTWNMTWKWNLLRSRGLAVALVVLATLAWPGPRARAASDGFVVIVNPENPVAEVSRDFLRDAFLRKTSSWSGGEVLRPVDLSRRFGARESFSRDVLKKTLPQLKRYWNQQVFSGKGVPPPELDSEKAVIAYVLANKGAIGYLPAGSDPGGARVVKVR